MNTLIAAYVMTILTAIASAQNVLLDQWEEIAAKEQIKSNNDGKKSWAEITKAAKIYFEKLNRVEKFHLVKSIGNSRHGTFIGEQSVIYAMKNEDAALLQITLENCYIGLIDGYSLFEYLAKNNDGRHVGLILCAYKNTNSNAVKSTISDSFGVFFGARNEGESKELYIRNCVNKFYSNKMWMSEKIISLKPMPSGAIYIK